MWSFSPEAEAALAGSHTAVIRVDIWHSGVPTGVSLSVADGEVTADAERPIRRNLDCSLYDPTGELTRGDIGDLLNPYECEVAPYRGVRTASGDELAPQGVFRLTQRDVQDRPEGLVIALTGQDRALAYQGPMDSALGIAGNTPVEAAIARLLARRNPALTFESYETGFTCGPLIYQPDIDVWAEAQRLAVSVGAVLFHDRTGAATLRPAGPTGAPVATYAEGGLLLGATRTEDYDTVSNVVVAENPTGTIRAVAEDTDPTSPTYARGAYGRRVAPTLISPHYGSVHQALVAATAELVRKLGRSETGAITAIPDPAQDVDETITAHRPRAGFDQRALVVVGLRTPLVVDRPMQLVGRRSVLAQDGRVLPAGGVL